MKKVLYKANKSNSGALFDLTFNSKEGALFVKAIKQAGWDDKNKTGSFKDNAGSESRGTGNITVKMDVGEISAIAYAIENQRSVDFYPYNKGFYHNSDNGSTQISFTFNENKGAFFFSLKKDDNKFAVGLSLAEAYNIKLLIERFLVQVAQEEYEKEQERLEKFSKNNNSSGKKSSRGGSSKKSQEDEIEEQEETKEPETQQNEEEDDVPF